MVASISKKLMFWIVAVTLLVMIVFGTINYFLFVEQLNRDLDTRLGEDAQKLEEVLGLHIWNLDKNSINEVTNAQVFIKSLSLLLVVDNFGTTIYEIDRIEEGQDYAYKTKSIFYEDQEVGVIEIAYSKEYIEIATRGIIRSTLVIIFAVFFAVLTISFFVSRSISKPIREISKASQEIAAGNLNRKVEVVSEDEVGQLGEAFNVMTSKLKESYEGLEEKVRIRTKELSASNRLKDLFMDIMRHDLLNPAGVVKMNAQLALSDEKDVKKRKVLESIDRNSNRMVRMIENASILAKLESGEKIEFKEEDLGVMLKGSVEELSERAKEKGMKVRVVAKGKFSAVVNPLIQNVFSNFISNAIKYCPEKTEIVVGIKDKGKDWLVYVEDRGEGIPAKYKRAVFERFTRLEKGAVKGTGLGLAISKKITEAHNGKIWVGDHKGGGAVFYVLIPKVHGDATPKPHKYEAVRKVVVPKEVVKKVAATKAVEKKEVKEK
jgi:signal transduction histidine kinase